MGSLFSTEHDTKHQNVLNLGLEQNNCFSLVSNLNENPITSIQQYWLANEASLFVYFHWVYALVLQLMITFSQSVKLLIIRTTWLIYYLSINKNICKMQNKKIKN